MHHFTYILIVACTLLIPSRHPYFISVTEIRSDASAKTFNVSCRMFTDDLQTALYKKYGYKAELSNKEPEANQHLLQYITSHLQVKVDGYPVALSWVGYEIEEEATWCYLEATTFPGNTSVEVTNTLLYDYIAEQTNFVHFYRDGKRNSTKLVNPQNLAKW